MKGVVTRRTAGDSTKMSSPIHRTTQTINKSIEQSAGQDTFLTRKGDFKKIEQNVEALKDTLLSLKGDIQKINQNMEALKIQVIRNDI